MLDAEILNLLLRDAVRVELQNSYGKYYVVLDEPQAVDSSVIIRGLPHDSHVIKVDSFSSPDNIFKGVMGECRRADYVIISESKKRILYIELKKTKAAWGHIVNQLMGAECFVKYCREIGKSFWNEPAFMDEYEHRFISIGHTSIAKRKTRIEKTAARHDAPNRAMKIDWPNTLQFNHLAGA
jgi:hypothetical protein